MLAFNQWVLDVQELAESDSTRKITIVASSIRRFSGQNGNVTYASRNSFMKIRRSTLRHASSTNAGPQIADKTKLNMRMLMS